MYGQDGQQVLIKYGSNYVKVHLCRLSLEKTTLTTLILNELFPQNAILMKKITSIQKIIPVAATQFMILFKLEMNHSQYHLYPKSKF